MSNYLYDSNIEFWNTLNRNYIHHSELSVNVYSDAIVIPYHCEKLKVDILNRGWQSTDNQLFVKCNSESDKDWGYIDEEVIYIGDFWTRHYGNFLIDYLCRLWYNSKVRNKKIIYVSNGLCIEKERNYLKILEYLQIGKEQLQRITEPTVCATVYVPEKSMIHDYYVTNAYAQIYEDIWQNIEQRNNVAKLNKYEKIYLTRQQLKKHKEIGEYIFERFFQMNGFEVIAPETLSFEEQVCLFRNAKEIASIEGTHAHNIIFKGTSRKSYKQIILSKQSEVIPRQIQLNQITGGEAIWIDVYCEPFKGFPISHDRGPFLLKWNEQIEQYAHDNHMILPKFRRIYAIPNMIIYICKCIGYWLKHNIKRVYLKIKSK